VGKRMIEIDYKMMVKRLEIEGIKFPISKWKLTKALIDLNIAPNKAIAHRTILRAIQHNALFSNMDGYNWWIDNVPDRPPELIPKKEIESKEDKLKAILEKNGGRVRSAVLKRILINEGLFTTERGAEYFIKRNIQAGILIKESYRRNNYLISYQSDNPKIIYIKDIDDIITELTEKRIKYLDLKKLIIDKCGLSYNQSAIYIRQAIEKNLIKKTNQMRKRNFYVIKV
jgi:hypothetical protein